MTSVGIICVEKSGQNALRVEEYFHQYIRQLHPCNNHSKPMSVWCAKGVESGHFGPIKHTVLVAINLI